MSEIEDKKVISTSILIALIMADKNKSKPNVLINKAISMANNLINKLNI